MPPPHKASYGLVYCNTYNVFNIACIVNISDLIKSILAGTFNHSGQLQSPNHGTLSLTVHSHCETHSSLFIICIFSTSFSMYNYLLIKWYLQNIKNNKGCVTVKTERQQTKIRNCKTL